MVSMKAGIAVGDAKQDSPCPNDKPGWPRGRAGRFESEGLGDLREGALPDTVFSMPERSLSRTRLAQLSRTLLDVLGEITEDNASVKNVHRLRTTVRRLEVAMADAKLLTTKKVQKQLTVLRRRAGHIRDADIQIEKLSGLRGSGSQQALDELSAWLRRRRNKYHVRLAAAVQKNGPGLAKRLERLEHAAEVTEAPAQPSCFQAVQAVRERYLSLSAAIPQGGDALHDFRKSCKQLRYTLEPVPDACAHQLVSRLKQVQDAIGDWHDWEELAMHAENKLKRRSLPLLAVLHSRARSARIEARRSAAELREELLITASRRKPVASVSPASVRSMAR